MSLVHFPTYSARHTWDARTVLPRAPQTLAETGLSAPFLAELIAKTVFQLGLGKFTELCAQLCLGSAVLESACQFMRREGLIEIARRGANDADVRFELTENGRARAIDWLGRNSYVGPAPVPLADYTRQVALQSIGELAVTRQQVRAAFSDLVVPADLQDQLGIAVNSGRPMLLHGPSGSGKSYLAQSLQRLVGGVIAIPHAICVAGEIIRVFDAQCHQALASDPEPRAALDNRDRADARWLGCHRPCVVSGGELTLRMLDLSFDGAAGYYEAPPHIKANNGLYIVDDLGRQVVTPRELMNRWVVPMERRHDHLMLRTGAKFTVPFDMKLVFSSNLRPAELADAAFLRRLGHKIEIDPLLPDAYAEVFARACVAEGIAHDPANVLRLVRDYHAHSGIPLLACYPRDLLHLVASRARYFGIAAELSPELLDWAWHAYFGNTPHARDAAGTGSEA